jgi:hypothetical protein
MAKGRDRRKVYRKAAFRNAITLGRPMRHACTAGAGVEKTKREVAGGPQNRGSC